VSAIAPNNNEVLTYDTPTLLWKPKTVISALGYTPFQLPTLTSGSVLFSNGTTIAQDNANFFFDNTNNRLGIGTNAPAHTLQVYRNTSGGYLASFNSGAALNTNASLTVRIENSNLPSIQGLSPGAGGFNTFALNPLGGNVLIGTTTDNGGKLQIKAPGALSTDIALRVRNSADTGDLMTINGLGALKVGGATDGVINLGRGGDGATIGAVFVTGGTITTLYNYQGSGIDLSVAGSGTAQRAVIRSTGVGFSGTTGGTFTLDTSALLQGNSTTQGFLPPRMTTTQKNAIATPASGLVVYDTTLGKLCVRGAAAWETITSI